VWDFRTNKGKIPLVFFRNTLMERSPGPGLRIEKAKMKGIPNPVWRKKVTLIYCMIKSKIDAEIIGIVL